MYGSVITVDRRFHRGFHRGSPVCDLFSLIFVVFRRVVYFVVVRGSDVQCDRPISVHSLQCTKMAHICNVPTHIGTSDDL